MCTIDGAIEALKNSGIHFTIVDNAEVHDGDHGGVGVVHAQEDSRQADSLLARRHGGTGFVSAKTGHVAKICCQCCVSPTCC